MSSAYSSSGGEGSQAACAALMTMAGRLVRTGKPHDWTLVQVQQGDKAAIQRLLDDFVLEFGIDEAMRVHEQLSVLMPPTSQSLTTDMSVCPASNARQLHDEINATIDMLTAMTNRPISIDYTFRKRRVTTAAAVEHVGSDIAPTAVAQFDKEVATLIAHLKRVPPGKADETRRHVTLLAQRINVLRSTHSPESLVVSLEAEINQRLKDLTEQVNQVLTANHLKRLPDRPSSKASRTNSGEGSAKPAPPPPPSRPQKKPAQCTQPPPKKSNNCCNNSGCTIM